MKIFILEYHSDINYKDVLETTGKMLDGSAEFKIYIGVSTKKKKNR